MLFLGFASFYAIFNIGILKYPHLVFFLLSLFAIPSSCVIIFYLSMQYFHRERDNLHLEY
jgi:membrane protein DedA with SNARE-associated domain